MSEPQVLMLFANMWMIGGVISSKNVCYYIACAMIAGSVLSKWMGGLP